MAYPHPAFRQTHKVTAGNMIWAEFKASIETGIDLEVLLAKDRNMRALIVGGIIASNALENMRLHDMHEDAKRDANRK